MVFCPNCYSTSVRKYGFDRSGAQKYICTKCNKKPQFTEKTGTTDSGMRHPKNVILYALNLHYRHGLPLRDIEEKLRQKGVDVSHVAVHEWAHKFGSEVEQMCAKYRQYARRWYIDTRAIRVNGREYYLWAVHDSNGVIISIRASPRKSLNPSEDILRDAFQLAGFKPEAIIGNVEGMQEQIKSFMEG